MEQNETRTLWISIAAGLFAAILLYGWAQDKRANYARKFGQTKTVVIARDDIQEMEILDASKLEVVERPTDFIQPLAIQNPTEVIGQLAIAPIKKGEQILNSKLVFPDKTTGLSFQVSPGKRAVTIRVDDEQAVAKLIKPGDRVDAVASVPDGKGLNKALKARTFIYGATVLAVGQNIVDNLPIQIIKGDEDNYEIRNLRVDNDYDTLTIEVYPSEAQMIHYLRGQDIRIFFSLRNPNDSAPTRLKTGDMNDVFNRSKKPRAPARSKNAPKVKSTKKQNAPKPAAPKEKRSGGRFETI